MGVKVRVSESLDIDIKFTDKRFNLSVVKSVSLIEIVIRILKEYRAFSEE